MRRGSISPSTMPRRRALAWALGAGLLVAPLPLVESGCGAFCSSEGCADGGAWFLLSGPEGEALAESPFVIEIETDKGMTAAICEGGDYGPAGSCVDEVLFFHDATGSLAIGELAFDENTDAPILAMQVFERVPSSDPEVTHVRGPERITVRIIQGEEVALEETIEPTYSRFGSERCGFCDQVEMAARLEVDLSGEN